MPSIWLVDGFVVALGGFGKQPDRRGVGGEQNAEWLRKGARDCGCGRADFTLKATGGVEALGQKRLST
jgi:hypothetical protein